MNEAINHFDTLDDWVRRVANQVPILHQDRVSELLALPHYRRLKSLLGEYSDTVFVDYSLDYCQKYAELIEINEAQSVQVSTHIYSIDGYIFEFDSGMEGCFKVRVYNEKGYFGK